MSNVNSPSKISGAFRSLHVCETYDVEEDSPVLRLPSLAMQKVFCNLGMGQLADAARVCHQWSELVRSRPLWGGQQETCTDLGRLLEVTRAAPSWDTLVVSDDARAQCFKVHMSKDVRKLSVRAPSPVAAVDVVRSELGRQAEYLYVLVRSIDDADQRAPSSSTSALWDGLRAATNVKSLRLALLPGSILAQAAASYRWPQNLGARLPSLKYLQFELIGEKSTESELPGLVEAFKSLLLAHRRQLERVCLVSPSLLPLLEACPASLLRLTVPAVPGIAALLQRLSHLKELRFEGVQSAAVLELTRLLRTPCGAVAGLSSLALRSAADCKEAVDALADGRLSQLRRLQLAVPISSMESVDRALRGLGQLRVLTLRPAPTCRALDVIPGSAIPSLKLLVVLGYPCRPAKQAQYVPQTVCRMAALRRLIRRAPQPLHVLCERCQCGSRTPSATLSSPRASSPSTPTQLLAEHPEDPKLVPCSLCTEAAEVHKSCFPFGKRCPSLRYICAKVR